VPGGGSHFSTSNHNAAMTVPSILTGGDAGRDSDATSISSLLSAMIWRTSQRPAQLILVFFVVLVMVMTAIVPTPAEAITAIIIIVTLLYPYLLADLSRPPQALAPPTARNPSGFFERRGGSAERTCGEWRSIRGAYRCNCGAARHQTG
jgi:hypothetical protein